MVVFRDIGGRRQADVAELADAIDLGSIVPWRAGSSPVIRSKKSVVVRRSFLLSGKDLVTRKRESLSRKVKTCCVDVNLRI